MEQTLPPAVARHGCDALPARYEAKLAAIGVLSHEPRRHMREASRATWLAELPTTIGARFVLRGLDLTGEEAMLAEASRHGDLLFVPARSGLKRENGALVSLFLWLRCAPTRFPRAAYFGKADDDVWLRPAGWAALLASVSAETRHAALGTAAGAPAVYVGSFEAFSWRTDTHSPEGWGFYARRRHCKQYSPTLRGPFSFAKGAIFFLSRAVATLVGERASDSVSNIVANDTVGRGRNGAVGTGRGRGRGCVVRGERG